MTAQPTRRQGRPIGSKSKVRTERLPTLRLTLNLNDPVQAKIATILLESYQRGEYTKTALQMLVGGVDAIVEKFQPSEDPQEPSLADAFSGLVDWGDDDE